MCSLETEAASDMRPSRGVFFNNKGDESEAYSVVFRYQLQNWAAFFTAAQILRPKDSGRVASEMQPKYF